MRKKAILIGLIAVPIFLGMLSYQTWFAAFLATKYLAGRTDGQQGIAKSLIIRWRNYQIHLHHWLVALIVGGILVARGFYIVTPEGFYGVVSAVVFQGIYCYRDWYRIIRRRNVPSALPQPMSLVAENENMSVESPTLVTGETDINFITDHARRRVPSFASYELTISMPFGKFQETVANIPSAGAGGEA